MATKHLPARLYYAQHGEDRWIAEHLSLPSAGYFVEVGAADGVTGSNTLHFERRGWKGILVEPDPRSLTALLESGRTAEIDGRCVSSTPGLLDFTLNSEPTWSGLIRPDGHTIKVTAVTLTQLLDDHIAPPVIDLLSIDTEGTELDVWASLDLQRYRPAIVIVEFDTTGIRCDPEGVARGIEAHGYSTVHRTHGNLILLDEAKRAAIQLSQLRSAA